MLDLLKVTVKASKLTRFLQVDQMQGISLPEETHQEIKKYK